MRDLPAAFFALLQPPAEMLERFNKEALNVMRLQPQGLGPFHLNAELMNLRLGH